MRYICDPLNEIMVLLQEMFYLALKLTKNADKDKDKYSGYVMGFDNYGTFSLSNGSVFGRYLIIFGADMSSFVHDNNKTKGILILGKDATNGLVDTTLTVGKEYSINFTEHNKCFLNLYYNGANVFVNGVKSIDLKQKAMKLRQLNYV